MLLIFKHWFARIERGTLIVNLLSEIRGCILDEITLDVDMKELNLSFDLFIRRRRPEMKVDG